MSGKDHYYNKSKQEGYRSRAAYKLKQLDRELDLLPHGATVVDLGAAPGGWLQVAAEEVGEPGRVIGVDFQRIDDIDGVTTVRGDMTEDDTKAEVREVANGSTDVVLSDMAPNMTGEYNLDQARSVYLAQQALATARDLLKPGGHFAVKVFEGQDFDAFVEDVEESFSFVRVTSPDASRESSSEMYVVGKNYVNAPIAAGDVLTVTVEDEGSEGDGIAKVDGFTVFVSGASEGDEVEIEIGDVKPNYAFASLV